MVFSQTETPWLVRVLGGPHDQRNDLRHTHKTWLLEHRVLQLQRLGHKPQDVSDYYSHVTQKMVDTMLAGLERRWEQDCS